MGHNQVISLAKKTKHEKMVNFRREESRKKILHVLNTLKDMLNKGKSITFYSVSKEAGVSKSFVYNHPVIRNKIESYRATTPLTNHVLEQDSKDILIKAQEKKIKELKAEIRQIKCQMIDKAKYQDLQEEHKKLLDRYKRLHGEHYSSS